MCAIYIVEIQNFLFCQSTTNIVGYILLTLDVLCGTMYIQEVQQNEY